MNLEAKDQYAFANESTTTARQPFQKHELFHRHEKVLENGLQARRERETKVAMQYAVIYAVKIENTLPEPALQFLHGLMFGEARHMGTNSPCANKQAATSHMRKKECDLFFLSQKLRNAPGTLYTASSAALLGV